MLSGWETEQSSKEDRELNSKQWREKKRKNFNKIVTTTATMKWNDEKQTYHLCCMEKPLFTGEE